jgi:hypothetical protein
MKTQPWPREKLQEVRTNLIEHGYTFNSRGFWFPEGNLCSNHWFELAPLYDNVMLTLHYDDKRMQIEEILNSPSDYPEDMLETCLFFMDVLR